MKVPYGYLVFLISVHCLTWAAAGYDIHAHEICDIGYCFNGGLFIPPVTIFGYCRCICKNGWAGALCLSKIVKKRSVDSPTDEKRSRASSNTLLRILRR